MSVITQEGVSVLMEAARAGKTEVVVELVKAGANVDMQNEVRTCSDVTTLIYNVLHVQKHTLLLYLTVQGYTVYISLLQIFSTHYGE